MIIIYTADVKKGTTNSDLDLGTLKMTITEAFLSEFNCPEILAHTDNVLAIGEKFTEEQQLKLMLCPLAVKGKPGKIVAIHKVIEITKNIQDAELQVKILSGMIAFCDKVITTEDAEEIWRIIKMTKFDQIIYNEKMEAINKAEEAIALNFLNDGTPIEVVSRNTGLDIETVKELARKAGNAKEMEADPA